MKQSGVISSQCVAVSVLFHLQVTISDSQDWGYYYLNFHGWWCLQSHFNSWGQPFPQLEGCQAALSESAETEWNMDTNTVVWTAAAQICFPFSDTGVSKWPMWMDILQPSLCRLCCPEWSSGICSELDIPSIPYSSTSKLPEALFFICYCWGRSKGGSRSLSIPLTCSIYTQDWFSIEDENSRFPLVLPSTFYKECRQKLEAAPMVTFASM